MRTGVRVYSSSTSEHPERNEHMDRAANAPFTAGSYHLVVYRGRGVETRTRETDDGNSVSRFIPFGHLAGFLGDSARAIAASSYRCGVNECSRAYILRMYRTSVTCRLSDTKQTPAS